MTTIETLEETLNQNTFLANDVKQNILELISIFQKAFPNIALDKLNRRLQTLKVERSNKFINRDVSLYDFRSNILYFNEEELKKQDYDGKHVLMFELLNMITATEYQLGFNTDNQFEALNVGYTEILTNFLVGNNGDRMFFQDEAIATNLICVMIGPDILERAYFENNAKLLMNRFEEVGVAV